MGGEFRSPLQSAGDHVPCASLLPHDFMYFPGHPALLLPRDPGMAGRSHLHTTTTPSNMFQGWGVGGREEGGFPLLTLAHLPPPVLLTSVIVVTYTYIAWS